MDASFGQVVSRFALVVIVGLVVGGHHPEATAESPGEKSAGAEAAGESADEEPKVADADRLGPERLEQLRDDIDRILQEGIGSSATVGVRAVDVETGQVLYDKNGGTGLNPASNMKLLTSSAALDEFGPSETFGTRLLADEPEDGVVDGPLFVEGEGEAFLLFEDVVSWASQLELKGVDRIRGDIVIDDTIFDGEYLPPAFGQKDEDASYRAPIGAVSVNFNAVTVIVTPAERPGEAPDVRMFPPNDHVEIVNQARTVVGPGQQLDFDSEPDGEGATTIRVGGLVGTRSGEVRSRLRIDHPPAYAGSILQRALAMVGVEVDGRVRTGQTPDDAEVVVGHESQPLSYVIQAMNKWSNNFMAEQLLRRLGVGDDDPSTWNSSREKLLEFVEQAGIDPERIDIKNGSGLYDGNLVSPRQFTTLLRYMLDHRTAPEFLSSLAIAGTDGTLADRMDDEPTAGRVRAKTGTLAHVSALSGYVTTQSDRRIAFSILFNDTPQKAWRYRPVQDEIVRTLAGL